jgi:hypothetical protein
LAWEAIVASFLSNGNGLVRLNMHQHTNGEIIAWMISSYRRFIDDCLEIDMTSMVEAWDRECSNGSETLDENHPAWNCAVHVKGLYDDNGGRI